MEEGEDGNPHKAPGLARDGRNRIERPLPPGERGVVPADLGGQRVRRFVAGGGEKKRDVPDKTQCQQFGREVRHEVSSVEVAALLCKRGAIGISSFVFSLLPLTRWFENKLR